MIIINNIIDVKRHLDGLSAIIFDLDDTLYSEKEYVRSGYHIVARDVLTMIPDAEEKLWLAFEEKKPAFDAVLHDSNIFSEALKSACIQAYRYQKPVIHLYKGVVEMLTYFRAQNLKLGIITDGRPEGQWAKIEALGLLPLVDHIIVTDELGGVEYRKPCDTAFKLMSEKLDVRYYNMAYVGDNKKKDFEAPQKLKMKSIYFHNNDGLY